MLTMRKWALREAAFALGPLVYLVSWGAAFRVLGNAILLVAAAFFMSFAVENLFLRPGIFGWVLDPIVLCGGVYFVLVTFRQLVVSSKEQ